MPAEIRRALVAPGRLGVLAALLALALLAAAAPVAGARPGKLLPPRARVAGASLGELLGRAWSAQFAIPAAQNPFFGGSGDPCGVRVGGLLLPAWGTPATPVRCQVKPGTPVLVLVFASECSDREPPPYFGADEAARRACALRDPLNAERVELAIDGRLVSDFRGTYLAVSPPQRVTVPDGGIFGLAAGPLRFTAAGFVGVLKPLPPGRHVVAASVVVDAAGGRIEAELRLLLDVVPRGRG